MKFPYLSIFPFITLLALPLSAQQPTPEKALKYHEALLKHPNNPTVFSRFYDAWIDAQSIESLEAFLKSRAETHGGIDYAILARYQLRRGQDPNALDSLNKAIETLPNDPALLMERANLLVRTLDFISARKDLEAVTKLGNAALSIEATKLIGKSYLREGNPDAAIQAWEKILTDHPKNEDLLEDLVELASSSEQPEQALKYSEQLIAASTDPYKKALRLIRRGELLSKSGESDQAIALWSDTLSQTGEGSWLEREILASIELSYRRLDRIDLLSSKLEELATAHPRRLLIHRELAKLEAASGNIDSAIGRFREVLRRSPGELELREEFIRLLINAERFDDASAELGKMIATTPNNPELHLRFAELSFLKSQANPDLDEKTTSPEIRKSLEKAHEFLDPSEASGLRIANLMIRYGLEQDGETLLKQLSTKPDATTAPAEALAAEYTRTKRTAKALDILKELTKSTDPETVLRATNAMAPLTKAEIPFDILITKLPDFSNNKSYIAALIQASLAAKKPADAIPSALRLVRSSKLASEIQDATKLASAVITAADKTPEIITELTNINERSVPEICLLASLLEIQKDHEKSDALFHNTTDPNLLRFHSSILSIRGDFKAAIDSLNRLAESSGDNSASYYKELSDLQLRSGDSEAALKTLEKWIVAAPTDKTPWTVTTRLLREAGKPSEAIETTRRALTRFNNDEDLTASLADLYQQTGDRFEAERIYWKLYDQAPDPAAQSRWAARLSVLAHNHGSTEELREKFIQRSRSNNQSLGPILALAELARATRNHEALLEHLYQALRIKPKDIDIRLQVASAEKQIGNIEKQLSVLNEGIHHDSSGRIRTSLAQAFIDQGQVLKGMHMLRALSGERASDPRLIETAASSIASSGMIAEAIQYLEESLPNNTDWRARYLLADLLQQDGREDEAVTILLSIMDASEEIPDLTPSNHLHGFQLSEDNKDYTLNNLIRIVSSGIFRTQNTRHGNHRPLPSSLGEVKFLSKILLASISNLGNPSLNEKIAAANIDELTLISDIIPNHSEFGINYLKLIEKHPSNHELASIVISQGTLRNPLTGEAFTPDQKSEVFEKLLKNPDLNSDLRTHIYLSKIQQDPKNNDAWNRYFSHIENQPDSPSNPNSSQSYYVLYQLIAEHRENIPKKQFPKIKTLLLSSSNPLGIQQEIAIHSLLGELDPWIDAVNKLIKNHQEQMEIHLKVEKSNNSTNRNISYYGFHPRIPDNRSLPLSSISIHYFRNILSEQESRINPSKQNSFAAKDLIKHLHRFESPTLRAYIAILANDEKAIKKYLSVTPPEIEAIDFSILKIWMDIDAKRYPEACRGLLQIATSPTFNAYYTLWAKHSFLSLVCEISENKRTEFLSPARNIITSFAPPTTPTNPWQSSDHNTGLVQVSQKLGFDDLVKKYTPPTPTIISQHRNPSPSHKPTNVKIGKPTTIVSSRTHHSHNKSSISPIDRFHKLSSQSKNSAAAHELLNLIQSHKRQGSDISYFISQVKITPEILHEILTISDPGNKPSLSKRLHFIELCTALKEHDKALTNLRALVAERPFDPSLSISLAFLLPPDEIDTATNLLIKYSDNPAFHTSIRSNNQRIQQMRNNQTTFHYFSLITKFLELSDPEKSNPHAFSELNSAIYYFLTGNNLLNIPSLFNSNNSQQKQSPETSEHREISRKLAFAMLRHPILAESGFRYIRAAKWIEAPNQLDELARNTILISSKNTSQRFARSSNLLEYSAAGWICDRLKQSDSHNDIIPPDFLASLEKIDPLLPTLLKSFSSIKSAKDIGTFWNTGAMQEDSYQTSRSIIQKAVMEKISTTPGATEFFISHIKNLSQEKVLNSTSHRSNEPNPVTLFRAALASCNNQSETTIRNLCSAIVKVTYGDIANFSNLTSESAEYRIFNSAKNILDSIFNNYTPDAATAIRIIQAFDSLGIPLPNHYWLQTAIQKSNVSDPTEVTQLLEATGFFKDTKNWQPIAVSSSNHKYDNTTSKSSFEINRILLSESIIQNFNNLTRDPKFITLIENRKPQTFGSLVTAAFLSQAAERERLMLKAFKHAAPQLAKASPKELENFNLLTPYLPLEAIDTLPPQLQTKIKERTAKKVTEILQSAEQQFTYIETNPSQNPFNQLNTQISQLASYDLKKSIELFLRCHSIYKANIAYFTNNHRYTPQTYLNNIINEISSSRSNKPEASFIFYRAIINSPHGSEFGHGNYDSNAGYLHTIGSQLFRRLDPYLSKNTPTILRPWLIANSLPKEFHNDALAAMACVAIYSGHTHALDNAKLIFEKTEELSEKSREIALACTSISNWKSKNLETQTIVAQNLISLLNDPIFDSNSRTQIALCSLRNSEIIAFPPIAEAYVEIFEAISKQNSSMVTGFMIETLSSIGKMNIPEDSKPHLRKISEAFWNNANSPLVGGHPPLQDTQAAKLFITSIKVGDAKNTELLIPQLRSYCTGNLNVITSLILNGQFELTDSILPNDSQSFFHTDKPYFNNDLHDKIIEFSTHSKKPEQILRLESNLINSYYRPSNKDDLGKIDTRKQKLIEAYFKNPPKNPVIRREILSQLIPKFGPFDSTLEKEICDVAASLNSKETVFAWFNQYSRTSITGYPEEHDFNIICSAAMIQFINGDPSLFISTSEALTQLLQQTPSKDGYKLRPFIRPFIEPAYIATAQAIIENKTQSFPKILPSLQKLILEISNQGNLSDRDLTHSFSIYDFISHWENKPNQPSELLKKMNLSPDHQLYHYFSSPRKNFAFLQNFSHINNNHRLPPYGDKPIELATAILSRESLAPIFVTTFSWLGNLGSRNLRNEIKELTQKPPQTLSPSGKLYLQYHNIVNHIPAYPDKIVAYQALLKEVPNTIHWHNLTVNSKLHLIYAMGRGDVYKLADLRAVFDSIDPENVPEPNKDFYERMLKEIKNAEAKPE